MAPTSPDRFRRGTLLVAAGCLSMATVWAEPVPPVAGTRAPETEPLWEVGLFNTVASLPDYRGSDEHTLYVLPLPFLIYRGELLEANRDGFRGIFYKGGRLETDLSFSGNPPVSNSNAARAGMPRLNPVLEAGPALRYYLYREGHDTAFYLQAAVRGAVSFDMGNLHPAYEGLRGGLSLALTDYRLRPDSAWRFGFSAGLDFSEARYNRFFYDVTPDHVLPDRGPFQSAGGYGGCSLSSYAIWDLTRRLSWSCYVRWDNLRGAVFEDSPLVKALNNYTVGVALIWTLQESKEMVRRR